MRAERGPDGISTGVVGAYEVAGNGHTVTTGKRTPQPGSCSAQTTNPQANMLVAIDELRQCMERGEDMSTLHIPFTQSGDFPLTVLRAM